MKYTHRTIFRHFIVAAVLLYFPFVLRPSWEVLYWYKTHALYFIALFVCATLFGYISHWLVTRKIPALFIMTHIFSVPEQVRLSYRSGERQIQDMELGFYKKQVMFLFICSRCLAWWTGCLVGGLVSYLYWPEYTIWWYTAIMLVFFAVFTGSVAAFISVVTYFIQKSRKSSKKGIAQ